jgi:hypothetical protein
VITQDRLKELLHYDPKTGIFTWIKQRGPRVPGDMVTEPQADGYVAIRIDGILRRAHQLAWLYMTGEWADKLIDHRDTNRANNVWDNLRLSTPSQNGANSKISKNNTSGWKGVFLNKKTGKWRAMIKVNRIQKSFGSFVNKEDAARAYINGAIQHFGEFARAA